LRKRRKHTTIINGFYSFMSEQERVEALRRAFDERPGGRLVLDTKIAAAQWKGALDQLVEEGYLQCVFEDYPEDQYSRFIYTRKL